MAELRARSRIDQAPNPHYSTSSLLLHDVPPSSFDSLPTELIQEIFSLACPKIVLRVDPMDSAPFHFELALVCKTWRAIVVAHHALWATFDIDAAEPEEEWTAKFAPRLREYLQRSGTHPLTIQVLGMGGEDEVAMLCSILDAIILHSERWAALKLAFPLEHCFLQKLEAVRGRVPLLQRLSIAGPHDPYPGPSSTVSQNTTLTAFSTAPALRRLSVSNVVRKDSARALVLPWNHISHAELDSSSFRKMQSSLERSETLTTLTLSKGFLLDSYTPALLRSPVTLERLQVLRVRDCVGVGYMTCPALKRLEVRREDAYAICSFLNNSACSLAHLELRGFKEGSLSLIVRHASLAGLTFLHVEDHWIANTSLDILVLDSHRLLPVLETLCVDIELNGTSRKAKRSFKSKLRSLQWIIESRTYDRNGEPGTLYELNSTAGHRELMPLKEFRIALIEYPEGMLEQQDAGGGLQLGSFRSFCNSRDVLSVLRTHAWVA